MLIISDEANCHASTSAQASDSHRLSVVEENIVRYTAGYVIRKLESKYSRLNSQGSIQCLRVLREMGTQHHSQSNQWTRMTNRGGLYHVEDVVFELFVALEYVADKELTSIFMAKGLEKIKKDKLSWICDRCAVHVVHGELHYNRP